jgi:hypothetical protein
MKAGGRKAIVTDEHREEARLLKEIWKREKRPTQAEFGESYGIGGQSAVANFLNGDSALSLNAARGFAFGLGCTIADFSPRLAREVAALGALAPPIVVYGDARNDPAPGTPLVSGTVSPNPEPVSVEALTALGKAIEAAEPADRASAVAMLKAFIENPSANADILPLIARRLSGEFPEHRIAAAGGGK